MAGIVAAILFLSSAAGLALFLAKKLPQLKAVSEEEGKSVSELKGAARRWLENQQAFSYAKSPELLLEKALSTARVTSLRTEAKTGELLERIRSRAKAKRSPVESPNGNGVYGDDYWKQVKKGEEVSAGRQERPR